jgi:hypothetical protein
MKAVRPGDRFDGFKCSVLQAMYPAVGANDGLDQAVANLNCSAAVSSLSVLPRRVERLPLMPESNPEL